jgi:hypothetical protein
MKGGFFFFFFNSHKLKLKKKEEKRKESQWRKKMMEKRGKGEWGAMLPKKNVHFKLKRNIRIKVSLKGFFFFFQFSKVGGLTFPQNFFFKKNQFKK